jgi:hypothetical protein
MTPHKLWAAMRSRSFSTSVFIRICARSLLGLLSLSAGVLRIESRIGEPISASSDLTMVRGISACR